MKKQIQNLEIARMSSKGQLVIPQSIRSKARMKKGCVFAIAACNGTLVLKKIRTPVCEADMRTLRMVDEAWDDIERGRFKIANLREFVSQARKW